jgi:hypothetical protein
MAGLDRGLVPATPMIMARPCHAIGVAGTGPAMTVDGFTLYKGILELQLRPALNTRRPDSARAS